MGRKPFFDNLRDRTPSEPVVSISEIGSIADVKSASGPVNRQGRKQIAGFFMPEMSFVMHTLARPHGRSLQALMAESFNDVLRKYGESPIGE